MHFKSYAISDFISTLFMYYLISKSVRSSYYFAVYIYHLYFSSYDIKTIFSISSSSNGVIVQL